MAEFKKLTQLQEAIKIESKSIEDIYQIKVNADSLSALLLAQKEKKQEFEGEMAKSRNEFEEQMQEKKLNWEKEQASQSGKRDKR